MNMQRSALFEAPLAHETGQHFEWEMQARTPSTFTPIAVERPGGGRIKDKKPPNPSDIVNVTGVGGRRIPLHRLAAAAWRALVAQARADGIPAPLLLPTSGYRSPQHQAELWRQALKRYGSPSIAHRYVAPPGGSAHQSGRAIDFYLGGRNDSRNIAQLRTLPAYSWLVDNAECFGFYSYSVEPWHWEYNPVASSPGMKSSHGLTQPATVRPPALIGSENQPPGSTLFVDIPLGSEGRARPMTGIFIPENYHVQPSVDIILYLHGFKTDRKRKTIDDPHPQQLPDPGTSIDWYWHQPLRAFREGVNDSRKNVILVAPTLGQFSASGALTKTGGFDRYIDRVMSALTTYGPYIGQSPAVGNIILACHSGAGYPMRLLALSNQRYTSLIRECWGFDCMYNGGDGIAWADWANSNPNAKLYNYYRNTRERGTREESEILQGKNLPNVTVVPLSPQRILHNEVPITYWLPRILGASFLHPR